jgi:hypothetical protein
MMIRREIQRRQEIIMIEKHFPRGGEIARLVDRQCRAENNRGQRQRRA